MQLSDLEIYNPITIQCHDNPDADSISAGYGLYCYFKSKGKDVRLIYSGQNRIQKSNLKLMVERLNLPIEYINPMEAAYMHLKGLLITVDCQYGAGNVLRISADKVAIIDHHQCEITNVELSLINPNLGSCSTLVWSLLNYAGYTITDECGLGTALYYGLYTDTNQFSELYNPLDMDMRESVSYERTLFMEFCNSNLSLRELEVAGVALLRYSFNDDYGFAVIKSQPCDPNILGIISDFLLQVDVVKTCVVFNEMNDGYKFSVRSCIKEVNARELAEFLADKIGSGGGHFDRSGGFISLKLYEEHYPTLHAEGYFNNRMVEYFDSFEIIYASEYEADMADMKLYEKKMIPMGYVEVDQFLPHGTPVTIRTQNGDVDLLVDDDLYVVIGHTGEVYTQIKNEFLDNYVLSEDRYCIEEYGVGTEYVPTIKNRATGNKLVLTDYAYSCVPVKQTRIYAKPLDRGVKVFTIKDKTKYILGRPGDYFAVSEDDTQNVFVVERDVFNRLYDEVGNKVAGKD